MVRRCVKLGIRAGMILAASGSLNAAPDVTHMIGAGFSGGGAMAPATRGDMVAVGFGPSEYVHIFDVGSLPDKIHHIRPPEGAGTASGFGSACAWVASGLAISAPAEANGGALHFITFPGGGDPVFSASIPNPTPATGGFGRILDASGATLVVVSDDEAGLARRLSFFDFADGADGALTSDMILPKSSGIDHIAASPDFVAVGFPSSDSNTGAVVVLKRTATGWSEGTHFNGTPGNATRFGSALCWVDEVLWVGAPGNGRGEVRRFSFANPTSPVELPPLGLPEWVAGAGSAIALSRTGEVVVGAPGTDFSGPADQGAVLFYHRESDGDPWLLSDVISDSTWRESRIGGRLHPVDSGMVAGIWDFDEYLKFLPAGPRVRLSLEPQQSDVLDETDPIARWIFKTDRPVQRSFLFITGNPSGTATEGVDYIGFEDLRWYAGDSTAHSISLLPLIDDLPEGDETLDYSHASWPGTTPLGPTNPSVTLRDASAAPDPKPARIIARVPTTIHTNRRTPAKWETPEAISLSDSELVFCYPDRLEGGSTFEPFHRMPDGRWTRGIPWSLSDHERKVGDYARYFTNDDEVLVIGRVGASYPSWQSHIEVFRLDESRQWVPSQSLDPVGGKTGYLGQPLLLEADWLFGTLDDEQVHIYRRTGATFSPHSSLDVSDLPEPERGGVRTFGRALAWKDSMLAVGIQRPGANAQSEAGIAIFAYSPAQHEFQFRSIQWTGESDSDFYLFGWAGAQFVLSHDHREPRVQLIGYDPTTGFGMPRNITPPPGSRFSRDFGTQRLLERDRFFISMAPTVSYLSGFVETPQLVGYRCTATESIPAFSYSAPFPGLSRPTAASNINSRSEIVFHHKGQDRVPDATYLVALDDGRPELTFEPPSPAIDSDEPRLATTAMLSPKPHLPVVLRVMLTGSDGALPNRDYIPHERTFIFEIGQTTKTSSYGVIDNPQPTLGAKLFPEVLTGLGSLSAVHAIPAKLHPVRATHPTLNQRIVAQPGTGASGFLDYAYDGQAILLRQLGHDPSRFGSRRRRGRVFETENLWTSPLGFPAPKLDANSLHLINNLLVLGRPGVPSQTPSQNVQLGWRTASGEWSLAEALPSPEPYFASDLGKMICRNERFLVVAQKIDPWSSPNRTLLLAYDLRESPARLVGTIGSQSILAGDQLFDIDDQDRVFVRNFNGGQVVVSIFQIAADGVAPFGEIVPTLYEPGSFGHGIRCHQGRLFVSNYGWFGVGAIQIFAEHAAGWELEEIVLADEPTPAGAFGYAFALEDNLLVVGEPARGSAGSIHFLRKTDRGYTPWHRLDCPTNALSTTLSSSFGGKLQLASSCVVASISEATLTESSEVLYSIDLTDDRSFADWCRHHGLKPQQADSDPDGDGLSIFLEWAAGFAHDRPDSWWGSDRSHLWIDTPPGFKPAARVAIEFSPDLRPGSWSEVAFREGGDPWSIRQPAVLGFSKSGGDRIQISRTGQAGFIRLRAGELPPSS